MVLLSPARMGCVLKYSVYTKKLSMFVWCMTMLPVMCLYHYTGLPVPIVAVSVGIQHDLYGTDHL